MKSMGEVLYRDRPKKAKANEKALAQYGLALRRGERDPDAQATIPDACPLCLGLGYLKHFGRPAGELRTRQVVQGYEPLSGRQFTIWICPCSWENGELIDRVEKYHRQQYAKLMTEQYHDKIVEEEG